MHRYKLTVGYDGTAYAGWQIQPNGVTVQQRLQEALKEITGEDRKVHGSGRTDQGVHARRQAAHLDLRRDWQPLSLCRGLNALLPADIRVLRADRAALDFHARRSATGKQYRYFIWNAAVLPPHMRMYRAHVRRPLDVDAMRRAAGVLQGRHDFAAFSANPKRLVESTVRDLRKLEVRKHGSEITILAEGNGFLYKMVRSLAGFLVKAGQQTITSREIRETIVSRVRTAKVKTAPPRGLFLWEVFYR